MAHLVFQTAYPGDLFLSIPLLRRIREWDPQTPIVLACRPGLGQFYLDAGLVDETIEVNKKSPQGRTSALKRMRTEEWDVVFVPHESVRTALWMLRIKAKRAKVGFRKWWNFLIFSHRVVKPMQFPDALRQLSLLTPLDTSLAELFGEVSLDELRNPQDQPALQDLRAPPIPEWASMQVKSATPQQKKIFLAPGSVWATKRWTVSGYTELARMILERGMKVELVGSPAERGLCEKIAGAVPGVINRAGQTSLNGLVELLSTGTALVCNDSGAMHAAATHGLPTVAIFGPTTLAQGFRPWQNQAVVVQRKISCRPCAKHGGAVCPIKTHECMEKIEAREVYQALEKLL